MNDRQDFNSLGPQAVDDAIRMLKKFPDSRIFVFGDLGADLRKSDPSGSRRRSFGQTESAANIDHGFDPAGFGVPDAGFNRLPDVDAVDQIFPRCIVGKLIHDPPGLVLDCQ